MDEFAIEAVTLKSLQKVRVGHDSSGPGSGWFLDKIVVRDPEDNTKEFLFPCNRYAVNDSFHLMGIFLWFAYSSW